MGSIPQDDFSAGIWRGRKAPPGAVYDAVNAIVDDDGNLARRGRVIYPWTRWEGHAASRAYAVRVGSTTREPKLLGVGT